MVNYILVSVLLVIFFLLSAYFGYNARKDYEKHTSMVREGFGGRINPMLDYEVELMEMGRKSILEDFETVTMCDGFVGFTEEEWRGVKKFIKINKETYERNRSK
jgi:hypothetical protein